MFIGNSCNDCSRYNRMEMKNVIKDILILVPKNELINTI